MKIPFFVQEFTNEMEEAAIDALRNESFVNGESVSKFEEQFARYIGTKYAVSVNSGNSALQLSLMALDISNNSKVASKWYNVEGLKLKHPCVGLLQQSNKWDKTSEMLVLDKVIEKMPDVHFYWAGDGPLLERILPTLNKHDNFHWLGRLQYPDKVREYLSEIDVYALVTGVDMSPLSLKEAQLIKKLRLLLEDGDLVKKMGNEGRKFVEETFNWELVTKNFIKIAKSYLK